MFTVTINGNTLDELFTNISEMLNSNKPGAPATAQQPEPLPAQPITTTTPQVDTTANTPPQAIHTPPIAPTQPQTSPSAAQPQPGVPVAAAPTYTLDQLARAGAALAQSGKMNDALALLARYGVQTVNQLKAEQYGAFATELRALGAQV